MSAANTRLALSPSVAHPAVLDRRVRDLLKAGLCGLIPVALGLGVAIAVPKPNVLGWVAIIVGAVGIVALMVSPRLEVTVTVLALYLGLLAGPVKLLVAGGVATSALQDAVIVAVAGGALLRLLVKREPITLPPLSGWVIAFVALVLVEAFNPKTEGVLHFLGGFRQQLQWVPFFFFGYVLVRSTRRLRAMFIVLGVMALANGVVATYQTRLSPAALAAWGPGYRQRVYGTNAEGVKATGGRVYISEGEVHNRPPALGSDSGFGGAVGGLALPGCLALLVLWPLRRRWIGILLCFGALVAVATSLGRLEVVGALLAVMSFALLTSTVGRTRRPMAILLGVGILALPAGVVFVEVEGAGIFKRYESIAPERVLETSAEHKNGALSLLPHQLAAAPFGVGLGSVGAVGAFGGKSENLLEEHRLNADTQFNLMADELGLAGMVLWTAFMLYVIVLGVRGLRRVSDPQLRLALAAVVAPLIAMMFEAKSGPLTSSNAAGPYIFFAAGVIAYWFAGPGRTVASATRGRGAAAGASRIALRGIA